jgi:hypothetical protein
MDYWIFPYLNVREDPVNSDSSSNSVAKDAADTQGVFMRTKAALSMLLMTAVVVTFSLNEANAGFPAPPGLPGGPNVNVRVEGYLPAPPGVNVQVDGGRPYYVDRDRRVYMERERPGKHYKKKKNRGNKYGHYKEERRDHDRGNGRGR